ncbi:hypothetical protein FACS1894219_06240 [Clostridia bacterium]|nr:hypothetical protein FACS1894219_06240 [Clostridia bacterium]
MAFSKQFPIRIALTEDMYALLLEGLKGNEEDFVGSAIADEARALREKIEKHGRRGTDENGNEAVRLGFYEKEGVNFIWQFMAASTNAAEYRELLEFTDAVVNEYQTPAETEVE